jgi:endogenous inhibitor of DNA gyrase (YacG/DUF329 family)
MTRSLQCPICRKSVEPPATLGQTNQYPFCSERCRQVDLLRWSKGQYAIVDPLAPDQIREITAADDDGTEGYSA